MGAFLAGIGNYAKSRLLHKLGADPQGGLGNAIYAGYQRYRQPPNLSIDDSVATAPESQPTPDFAEPMGTGKIVTQPTLALIGDKGPEKVVPLTPSPDNKVNATMLPKTRYRHVSGPGAISHQRPLSADLPLIPNKPVR